VVKRAVDCPACVHGQREFLWDRESTRTTRLCGRNAVQLEPAQDMAISLEQLAENLERVVQVDQNGHLVRFWADDVEIIVFEDGRAIVRGTTDPTLARALYAKYVGM
jgi:adenylyltransferase/sulfurtransferase